jgi:membrane protease YdiL (CAAX protease family)
MATTRSRQRNRTLHPDHYFVRSQQPLQALFFLLPLIGVYEIGAAMFAHDPVTGERLNIRAWSYLRNFLENFGAVGDYLPGLAVILVLLASHIARKDRWRVAPSLYTAMLAESIALALPLLLFSLMIGRAARSGAFAAGPELSSLPWQTGMVLSIGAGLYEELVFRLAAIAILHMIFVDLIGTANQAGGLLAIVISSILFAVYHFESAGQITAGPFVFFLCGGLYFAVIYVLRGFGIVVATHAIYDIVTVAILKGFWPVR